MKSQIRFRYRTIFVALVVAFSIVTSAAVQGDEFGSVLWELLFGWMIFASRVLPNVRVRWDGILFFSAFFVLALACGHSFLSWIYRSNSNRQNEEPPQKWKLRWTATLLCMVTLVFGIGLSFTGVVHQTGWILTSPIPLHESKIQSRADQLLSGYDMRYAEPGRHRTSWTTAIMPFLPGLVNVKDTSKAWNHPDNANAFRGVHWGSVNPSIAGPIKSPDGFGLAHFAANPNFIEAKFVTRLEHLTNGQNQTYLLGECNAGFVPWGRMGNTRELGLGLKRDWSKATPGHLGYGPVAGHRGAAFFMADGQVRDIDVRIDADVLQSLNAAPFK